MNLQFRIESHWLVWNAETGRLERGKRLVAELLSRSVDKVIWRDWVSFMPGSASEEMLRLKLVKLYQEFADRHSKPWNGTTKRWRQ